MSKYFSLKCEGKKSPAWPSGSREYNIKTDRSMHGCGLESTVSEQAPIADFSVHWYEPTDPIIKGGEFIHHLNKYQLFRKHNEI